MSNGGQIAGAVSTGNARRLPWRLVAAGGVALLLAALAIAYLLLRDDEPVGLVLGQGQIGLSGGQVFDFDSGSEGDHSAADIELLPVAVNDEVLRLLNGARGGAFGPDGPGFSGCRRAELSSEPIVADDLAVGAYFCVLTSQGNLVEVRITNAVVLPSQPPRFGSMTISYTTFEGR